MSSATPMGSCSVAAGIAAQVLGSPATAVNDASNASRNRMDSQIMERSAGESRVLDTLDR